MRFEPSGFTKNPDIPMAKSIMDYIFRWQASKFLDNEAQQEVGIVQRQETAEDAHQKKVISMGGHVPRGGAPVASISSVTSLYQQDAPPCHGLRLDHDPFCSILRNLSDSRTPAYRAAVHAFIAGAAQTAQIFDLTGVAGVTVDDAGETDAERRQWIAVRRGRGSSLRS